MRITITARHCEISGALRVRAREVLERLGKIAMRPHDGQVTFSGDHGTAQVEVRLHSARGLVHIGTAEGADHRSALDLAAARVRRQLDKAPTRKDRRRVAAARAAAEREAR